MALELPTTLSPSKVSSFKDCALAFRFSAIDRLPEAPSAPATKGTLVHDALRRLLWRPAHERTLPNAMLDLAAAQRELEDHPDYADLGLEADDAARFYADAEQLVRNYFELEDPATVNPMGLELDLSVTVGSLRLRGIIDRLERGPDGGLVVTDYKSGSTPRIQYEQGRLGGVAVAVVHVVGVVVMGDGFVPTAFAVLVVVIVVHVVVVVLAGGVGCAHFGVLSAE